VPNNPNLAPFIADRAWPITSANRLLTQAINSGLVRIFGVQRIALIQFMTFLTYRNLLTGSG